MPTLMPLDDDSNPIPALRLTDGGAHTVAVTATSARNSVAFQADTRVISVFATGPVFIRLGDSNVSAATTDHFFPGGVYYDIAIAGGNGNSTQDRYIAVVRAETDCSLYISEKQ